VKEAPPSPPGENRGVREPLFLQRGAGAIASELVRDFGNFVLVLCYYPVLWLVGAPFLFIDSRFGTRLLDHLIALAEHLDE